MKTTFRLVASLMALTAASHANALDQYASSVTGFSSQWSSGAWSANQVLGAPDTFGYGDIPTAWAPSSRNGTFEYISLGFATQVYSTGAVIRETLGNGFVYKVDAIDSLNALHTVWTGTDGSLPGAPVDFSINWAATAFLTKGLKIYVDTNHSSDWEEIDSVKLIGTTIAPVPEPETYAMLLAGLGLIGMVARRRRSGRV